MPIDAVVFDLDDTLLAQEASDWEALRATCQHVAAAFDADAATLADDAHTRAHCLWQGGPTFAYCHAIGISAIEGLWARFDDSAPELAALRAWAPRYCRQTWGDALAAQGIHDTPLADEMAAVFARERRARQVLFPEVVGVLESLRGRYRMALLTNGAPDLQREKVRASGLGHFFDVVVVSGEEGVGKPDPRLFSCLLDRLGVAAARAAMVGDSLGRDIAGAQASGLRSVWINRTAAAPPGVGIAPDVAITDLRQLRDALS